MSPHPTTFDPAHDPNAGADTAAGPPANPDAEARRRQLAEAQAGQRPAEPGEIPAAAVERTILLLCSGVTRDGILAAAAAGKLDAPAALADATIAEARRRLTLTVDYCRDEEVGRAIVRLNDLYSRALKVQDVKTALAAERERIKLMMLDAPARPDAQPAAANPNQLPAAEAADRRPREAAAVELFDAIDAALEPLLPADDDATYPERIAQAAALVRRLTKALKRKPTTKPRKKTPARKGRPHAHE